MHGRVHRGCARMVHVPDLDATDRRILVELTADARLSGVELAQRLGLSRNTVQARLARLESSGALGPVDRRVPGRSVGYPLTAFVSTQVDQRMLRSIETAMAEIDEVTEMHGVAGGTDLVIRIVARDTDDLYRVAGLILATPGVERTEVLLSVREMVPLRMAPLLRRSPTG